MEEETLFISGRLSYRPQVATVLSCILLNQVRHFEDSWRNLLTEYNPRENRLDLGVHWEISNYIRSAFAYWKQELQIVTLTQFSLKTNFANGSYFEKSAKYTASEIYALYGTSGKKKQACELMPAACISISLSSVAITIHGSHHIAEFPVSFN